MEVPVMERHFNEGEASNPAILLKRGSNTGVF